MPGLAKSQEAVVGFLAVSEELRPFMIESVISGEGILWGSGRQQMGDQMSFL